MYTHAHTSHTHAHTTHTHAYTLHTPTHTHYAHPPTHPLHTHICQERRIIEMIGDSVDNGYIVYNGYDDDDGDVRCTM